VIRERAYGRTSTCPESCWENSPGRPSNRTSGRTVVGRRAAISSYNAVCPPAYPVAIAACSRATPAPTGLRHAAECVPQTPGCLLRRVRRLPRCSGRCSTA
jgi:hypothetical protein